MNPLSSFSNSLSNLSTNSFSTAIPSSTTTPQMTMNTAVATPKPVPVDYNQNIVAPPTKNPSDLLVKDSVQVAQDNQPAPTINSTPFTLSSISPTTSYFSQPYTYNDVIAKRQQYENQYAQDYADYAAANTGQQVGQLNDLAREQNALYSGDTTDYGMGVAGLVKNQDIIKQAARAVNTQGALLRAQGTADMLGYNQQDIGNQLNYAPQNISTQVSPTGDIISVSRNPVSGQTKSNVIGNIYGSAGGGSMNPVSAIPNLVKLVMSGQMSPSAAYAAIGNNAAFNSQINQAILQQNPNFNFTQAEANATAQGQALTQNVTLGGQLQKSAGTVSEHLSDLEGYFNGLSATLKTPIPAGNNIAQFIAQQLGSGPLQQYKTALTSVRAELAKVLAGGGAPGVEEIKQADATLPDGMSPEQFKGAVETAKKLMGQKIAQYTQTGNVPQYGGTQSSSTSVQPIYVQTLAGAVNTNW